MGMKRKETIRETLEGIVTFIVIVFFLLLGLQMI